VSRLRGLVRNTRRFLVAATELNTRAEMDVFVAALAAETAGAAGAA
jgi:hypothetical protein